VLNSLSMLSKILRTDTLTAFCIILSWIRFDSYAVTSVPLKYEKIKFKENLTIFINKYWDIPESSWIFYGLLIFVITIKIFFLPKKHYTAWKLEQTTVGILAFGSDAQLPYLWLNARLLMRVESDFFHDHKIESQNRNFGQHFFISFWIFT
jgi:hypothetical protein